MVIVLALVPPEGAAERVAALARTEGETHLHKRPRRGMDNDFGIGSGWDYWGLFGTILWERLFFDDGTCTVVCAHRYTARTITRPNLS